MKMKTPGAMAIEKIKEIERMGSASECSLDCESKTVRNIINFPSSFELCSVSPIMYASVIRIPVCNGGYDSNIQRCPKYQAEIDKLREEAKVLSGKT